MLLKLTFYSLSNLENLDLEQNQKKQLFEWFQKENKGLPEYVFNLLKNKTDVLHMLLTELYTWTLDGSDLTFGCVIKNAISNSHEFEFHDSPFVIYTFEDILADLNNKLLIAKYIINLDNNLGKRNGR